MKERIDFKLVKSLLKKLLIERAYNFKRKNFDAVGFALRLLIVAACLAVFIIFYGRFVDIYASIKTDNALNPRLRVFELLTVVYSVVILFLIVGAVSHINREIFAADDVKIFSAMPVGAKSLFVSKLIVLYAYQFVYASISILAINITTAVHVSQSAVFFVATAFACFVVPFVTIAVASVFALPYHYIKRALSSKFSITFIIITVICAALFALYALVLSGVKELLLGDNLRYFFNEQRMNAISRVVSFMYPARWFANVMTGREVLFSWIGIAVLLAVCLALSIVIIKNILGGAMQSRMAGSARYIKRGKNVSRRASRFNALLKKEFLMIFRTPSYMFSYFSVAVLMPLMVYFCMSIGSSLVVRLVGLNCNTELALFLTLIFGALTNVFCATNISRDGQMFYTIKAMPIGYKSVFFSKILLCLWVTGFSQFASALVLFLTGYTSWYFALFLFAVGTLFSFVNICVATRYDFNHARFSTEDDGEITESRNAVSMLIVLGLAISIAVGVAVFFIRITTMLRGSDMGYLTYLVSGVSALVCAALAYFYFIFGLKQKYYEFQGGGI